MPSVRVLLTMPIDEYNSFMRFMEAKGERFVSPVVREFIRAGMENGERVIAHNPPRRQRKHELVK